MWVWGGVGDRGGVGCGKELRWGAWAWLLSLPRYPFRDHVFSFDLQAQEEGEGLVPNKVRGVWEEVQAQRRGWERSGGGQAVGIKNPRGTITCRGIQVAPLSSLFDFPLQYLTWRSQDMENCAVRGKLTVRSGMRISRGGFPTPELHPRGWSFHLRPGAGKGAGKTVKGVCLPSQRREAPVGHTVRPRLQGSG